MIGVLGFGGAGVLSGGPGVEGVGSSGSPGVTAGYGVQGTGGNGGGTGVYATGGPSGGAGIYTTGATSGQAPTVPDGDGIYATNADGGTLKGSGAYAGYFEGDINVTGAVFAGTKDFRIDHPLDPGNEYLVHASVESSEMINVYSGNVKLDGRGEAVLQLPSWFEALNGDFGIS